MTNQSLHESDLQGYVRELLTAPRSQNNTVWEANSAALEKVMRRDRKWFRRRPERRYRARPFVPGELPETKPVAPDYVCWTLVHRIAYGLRARVFVHLPKFAAPQDNDTAIGGMFDRCVTGGGGIWTPLKDLRPSGAKVDGLHPAQWSKATVGGVQ